MLERDHIFKWAAVFITLLTFSNFTLANRIIYVDDDGPADFNTIQAAIDDADNNDIVFVLEGTYYENIEMKNGVLLQGEDREKTIINGIGSRSVVTFQLSDGRISGFTLTQSGSHSSGVFLSQANAIIDNNIIKDNRYGISVSSDSFAVISGNQIVNNKGVFSKGINIYSSKALIKNNIITGSSWAGIDCDRATSNFAALNNVISGIQYYGIRCGPDPNNVIKNNIIVNNKTGIFIDGEYLPPYFEISHNNVWNNSRSNYWFEWSIVSIPENPNPEPQGNSGTFEPQPGTGEISCDPCFANSGYWDENGTPNDDMDDFWVDGDYHLMSQAGRFDPNSQACPCTEPGAGWVIDDVTSPCIDAGDPNSPIREEPFPNGTIINMGAYGGTEQASKSLSDFLFFSDFWPFEVSNRWWNAYRALDAGIDYEITELFDSNGFDIWHFEYEYVDSPFRPKPPKDFYWIYVNDGLYKTSDINDIDSLPNITGQMKLQYPEKIQLNEPISIPRFKPYGNVIALQGTLEEVLELSQTNPEISEHFRYDVNDFPAGNHGNVLAFAEDSNEGTTLIELYGYHFGPMLQGSYIMDGIVDIDTLVKITNPAENETFNRNDTIEIEAEVVHTTSPVIKMEFMFDIYIPQIQIGTDIDGSDGWSVQWEIPFGGTLPLRVRATTESGMIVGSKPIYINVQ